MDILNWIGDAQTSLHVHMYIIQSSELTQSLIDAQSRGVDVTVVLNEPEDWWNYNDKVAQEAYAYALKEGGISVHWFGGSGDDHTHSTSIRRLRPRFMLRMIDLVIGNHPRSFTMATRQSRIGEFLSTVLNLQ